ncbi:MAG: lipid-A-disaccharide synthase [Gammaproteobacteria bacterium]|nr:lipid-A-disaccharide synthase [Gammaproteobacteria bacterium]
MSIRIAIVAGEASGDLLGARLMKALIEQCGDIQFEGVAGPLMQEAGCKIIYDSDRLAVMGIVEILGRYRELSAMRSALIKHWTDSPPDLFIGIDAPDFNLGLAERLHRKGIPTCHYVSPSVWAWRKGRIKQIKRAVDLVLTLLPFEKKIYDEYGVPACFSGHPLADEIPLQNDQSAARVKLGLEDGVPLLAVLPGSRDSELKFLAEQFIATAKLVGESVADLQCVCPLIKPNQAESIKNLFAQYAPELPVKIIIGDARTAMAAADVVLIASGTATLEATLLKKPMAVGYRIAAVTYFIVRKMISLKYFALPNLLAKQACVAEFIQSELQADLMAPEVIKLFKDKHARQAQTEEFTLIHQLLRCDASRTAARAVVEHFSLCNNIEKIKPE